jgi:tripartite-type tricarboxylate transporter receptor subunit TctC
VRRTRNFIAAAVTGVALLASPQLGMAQDWPDRPITLIVPSSAGSGFDVVARAISDKLGSVLGQPIVIENIAGAGGTIGATKASEADPDGYTVLLININHPVGEAIYQNKSYDLLTDFIPVVRFAKSVHAFVVNPNSKAQTLADIIAMAKENPGGINYATAGVGSSTFMILELFKSEAGVEMTHIPYEGGGPALASVVAGETEFYGAPYSTSKPFIEEGTVRALAASSKERIEDMPDLPSASETLEGFDFVSWYGFMLPKGTPVEIRDKLYEAATETLSDPEIKQRLVDIGFVDLIEGPDEFAVFLEGNVALMKELVDKAGIEKK